jgi:hypothetical protein
MPRHGSRSVAEEPWIALFFDIMHVGHSFVLVAVVAIGLVARDLPAAEAEARVKALGTVRAAAAARDLEKLKAALAEATQLGGDAAYDDECRRLEELAEYLGHFWAAVDRAARRMQAQGGGELEIADHTWGFIEYDGSLLVLRVAGRTRRYSRATLPGKVALAFAERALDPKAAANKVFLGAFLVMDGRGDRTLGRRMWEAAQQAGTDVARLLPELDTPPPSPPVEIPQLSAQARLTLQPKFWALRAKSGTRWTKRPLADHAEQNDEGRLELAAPDDAGEAVQFVLARNLGPTFVCRVILDEVSEGQRFGLFSADGDDEGYVVALPPGTVSVEFSRKGGVVTCRVHGKEATTETIGTPAPQASRLLGLMVPAGQSVIVAALDLSGR